LLFKTLKKKFMMIVGETARRRNGKLMKKQESEIASE
jgi:hypothetical protein